MGNYIIMNGFSRHLTADFTAYNAQATSRVIAATGDNTISNYTYSLPDADPLYCWAREEAIFISIMTPEELATVVSQEDAFLQGMVIIERAI